MAMVYNTGAQNFEKNVYIVGTSHLEVTLKQH